MHNVDGLYNHDLDLEVCHFGITVNNMLIMVCQDEEENYFYYEIEPIDF
jgi:hypothetical protein